MKIIRLLLWSVILIAVLPVVASMIILGCWIMGPVGLAVVATVVFTSLAFVRFFVRDHGGLTAFLNAISDRVAGHS